MTEITGVATVVGAIVAAIGIMIGLYRSPDRTRARLKTDAEILSNLPPDSHGHKLLLADLNTRIATLTPEPKVRRDSERMSAALILTVLTLAAGFGPLVTIGASQGAALYMIFMWTIAAASSFIAKRASAKVLRAHTGGRIKPDGSIGLF